jgi:hypothetical protein
MQGMIIRNGKLSYRSFLADSFRSGLSPLAPAEGLFSTAVRSSERTAVMALFSRKKTPPASPPNPFVRTPEQEAARREREAAEAAAVEAARVVYEPRKGGRPTVENPRTKRVSLSLSDEEHETLVAAAEGRRVSVWARERLLESLAKDPTSGSGAEVARLRADLGRVGSNLNQLVRAVNSGQTVPSAELLDAVQATREELARVRGELP